jgi:DNA polymerase bacteriophage-type
MLALPLSLEGVGEVLDIQRKKLKEGTDLVRYFSIPCKPTKANGGRTRNLPEHAPEKWKMFISYCIRDVDAEREKLRNYPIPDSEMELYRLDQEINDRGILIDPELVSRAVECDLQYKDFVTARAYELTGLNNPNSVTQVKGWLSERGVEVDSLNKNSVKGLLSEMDGEVLEVLKLRILMAKTSIKKYEAIERSVCSDGRVHGLLQFYGANRTRRWAGRLVQVQNLPQNHLPDLALARNLIKQGPTRMWNCSLIPPPVLCRN